MICRTDTQPDRFVPSHPSLLPPSCSPSNSVEPWSVSASKQQAVGSSPIVSTSDNALKRLDNRIEALEERRVLLDETPVPFGFCLRDEHGGLVPLFAVWEELDGGDEEAVAVDAALRISHGWESSSVQ